MGRVTQTNGKGSATFVQPVHVRVETIGYRGVQILQLFRNHGEQSCKSAAKMLDFGDHSSAYRAMVRLAKKGLLVKISLPDRSGENWNKPLFRLP